jgi:hypothetical protein
VNATQAAILRALELCRVLDVEHTVDQLHRSFRAVRHELETLHGLCCPQAVPTVPELASAHTGRATRPGSLRHKILATLALDGMADFEVRDTLARDRADGPDWPTLNQVRRRRHELMAAGWVERERVDGAVRKVRHGPSGRDCSAYQITREGGAALRRLSRGQEVLFSESELFGND